MATRIAKPTSPGRRGYSLRDFGAITQKSPTKSLLSPLKKTGGRNNMGRITVRHIGGGHKRRYRLIDFTRREQNKGTVVSIEYDPNRSANIALIRYVDDTLAYILAPKDLTVGGPIQSNTKAPIVVGNAMMLKNIPTGVSIHNIELAPGKGGSVVRSAGLSAAILAQEDSYAVVKMPSGELRRILNTCYATIGEVSNATHENMVFGKAGRKRWFGIRPTVRGKAMNPNTHPHGGGEGNNSIGMKYPKTPWGAPALGHRTRNKKLQSSRLVIRRRK